MDVGGVNDGASRTSAHIQIGSGAVDLTPFWEGNFFGVVAYDANCHFNNFDFIPGPGSDKRGRDDFHLVNIKFAGAVPRPSGGGVGDPHFKVCA